ncbi:MAG: hypothetical protein CBD00_07220 [Rhodospirillaceae bacterium TMED140]|nr:MAG: hypothetical protein CBD00_07220 [Rhodospirillaceae bacterium TMED140]
MSVGTAPVFHFGLVLMLLRSSLFLPALILASSAALLLGAWGFELIGGLLPCKLCLQQRVPHYLLAALIIPAVVLVRFRAFRLVFFVAASGLMAAAAFLAAKHVGVEFGWWQGPMDCGGRVQTIGSADELFSLERPDCSKPTYILPGITMAMAHLLAVLPLLALSLLGLWRSVRALRVAPAA